MNVIWYSKFEGIKTWTNEIPQTQKHEISILKYWIYNIILNNLCILTLIGIFSNFADEYDTQIWISYFRKHIQSVRGVQIIMF